MQVMTSIIITDKTNIVAISESTTTRVNTVRKQINALYSNNIITPFDYLLVDENQFLL